MKPAVAPAFGALGPCVNSVACGVCPGLVFIIASLADDESLPAACVAIMPLTGHVWGGGIHPGAGFPGRRIAITRQTPQKHTNSLPPEERSEFRGLPPGGGASSTQLRQAPEQVRGNVVL